ncbi:AGE family epimerase/isomerase [Mucilaginibacter phyllosphaerae]|uniref:Mannobiose 2-epimerase n=2 Tax=Mucilaginibacter phyllosphaerae TaxID=1812349 RepID=A0A4Y8AKA2_9SPHI|nr:AGE family epimerase/isomerase [Mucilaginibacter phyllosphaerae]MBB3968037.1 mannobiose 2-epimerase [Mucilaginibacter phyllosphaerae]TEW68939.1 N-acylglucosamine 2-epimerase [Mucilaginibacter phyllosphaerae]GGH01657.1 cellobiose 2-epimerase [Mucilaginibacter phyllosphaerae]
MLCGLNTAYGQGRNALAAEMRASMVNKLLKQWYPRAIDTMDGGFLSTFSYNFKPVGNQDKMIVTQARHIWSNAKAAQLFPDVKYYAYGAKHGYFFLRDVLWDKQYGGFYTYTDRQGKVKQSNFAQKEAYGNAFALYALAAYYQQSGDTSALNLAKREFIWLEQHSHDPIHKGYFQHMERDGTPVNRPAGISPNAELGYKDQNTSIHLLEAFTELYQVWPDELLRARLQEMLTLLTQTIINPKGYLQLFFQPNWTPVSLKDSSATAIARYKSIDHVSFGHDVETAYLMLEASHVLGIKNNAAILQLGKRMVDHALDNGWDNQVGGFYDEGFYFKDKPGISILADTKNWWAQAEGLNTLLIMSHYYPKDGHQYYSKFLQLWAYVKTYLIDQEHGDWYQGGIDKQPQYKTALKGQIWKGTYHNLRALINCVARLHPDSTPPAAPSRLKKSIKNGVAVLSWNKAADDNALMGYDIYSGNKRVAFTPLTKTAITIRGFKPGAGLYLQAIDLQGNRSARVRFNR